MNLVAAFVTVAFQAAIVTPASAPVETAPVLEGRPAPFTGILVREQRFIKLLDSELQLPVYIQKAGLEQKFSANIEQMYMKRLADATAPPPFYQTNQFHLWLGIFIGAAFALGALVAGAKIAEAMRQ